ncbi:cytochrome c550 [Pseudalkalibacillus berkeleyi]|uniref:Cytochrome c n=1 Tax=Pseudalkalibacillus berkeleyi TaxID=1069813 RepID=A0ABS9GZ37_9BACL|nr:cytochrome c [Pseudalkalibacillus berkeleyi]MCF6137949.1 cytochrome c [Pseudalkalibacillus berkeleyi]
MKRNPLIPFAITAVVGIAIMLVMSAVGVNEAKEKASGGGETKSGEEIVQQSCTSCHGQNLEGNVGPALTDAGSKFKPDEIVDIVQNGKGQMPAQGLSAEEAQKVAEFLVGGGEEGKEKKKEH